jgi:hypothetical protein
MSAVASITLRFIQQVITVDILPDLLEAGWNVNYFGNICYLPLNDRGDYNWQYTSIENWPQVELVIKEQKHENQTVGLGLTWKDSQVGGTFHFSSDGSMTILLSSNRIKLTQSAPFTDFSWYLVRLLELIISRGYAISEIECSDLLSD